VHHLNKHMKISLEQVESTLLERKIDAATVAVIIQDLEQSVDEESADKDKLPKTKWEHIVYLNDPSGTVGDDHDAWVVTYKEGVDAGIVLSKIRDAAKEQNEVALTKKKGTLSTLGEVFQHLKGKFIKEKDVKIKTKESVRVVVVNGREF